MMPALMFSPAIRSAAAADADDGASDAPARCWHTSATFLPRVFYQCELPRRENTAVFRWRHAVSREKVALSMSPPPCCNGDNIRPWWRHCYTREFDGVGGSTKSSRATGYMAAATLARSLRTTR